MLSLRKPSRQRILEHLNGLCEHPFSYSAVGCVAGETPPGFVRDRAVLEVGRGPDAYAAAVEALRAWAHFPEKFVEMVRLDDEIAVGSVVSMMIRVCGVWSVNAARILSVEDTMETEYARFGFTYGTLPGHVEAGEERFRVQWDRSTDVVTYELEAVSRPKLLLVWLVYPFARWLQARFRKLSGEGVREFVVERTRATAKASPVAV